MRSILACKFSGGAKLGIRLELLDSRSGDPSLSPLSTPRCVIEGAGDSDGQLDCAGASSLLEVELLEVFLLLFTDLPFLLPNMFIMAVAPCNSDVRRLVVVTKLQLNLTTFSKR